MGYLFMAVAALACGGQFALSKLYNGKVGGSTFAGLFFNFASGLLSAIIFAVVTLGAIGFGAFSVSMAAGIALCTVIYTMCNLKAVEYGKVSVFTVFLMLGGMIFPAVYGGIWLHEEISVFKILGISLLVCSMIFSMTEKTEEKKNTALFYVLCVIAFVCNGFVSVLSKAHQITEGALDTFSFAFWQAVTVAVIVGVPLAITAVKNRNDEDFRPIVKKCFGAPSLGIVSVSTVVTRGSGVLLLLAAKTVPASLLYPVVTGVTILFTAISGRIFFGEKISKINAISLIADTVAVVLMIF